METTDLILIEQVSKQHQVEFTFINSLSNSGFYKWRLLRIANNFQKIN